MGNKRIALRENEQIFKENIGTNFWKSPQLSTTLPFPLSRQQLPAATTFTNQRIVSFKSILAINAKDFEFEIKDIQSVEKALVPPFFLPVGIKIVMKNGDIYLMYIVFREQYIHWITDHMNAQ